MTVEVSFRLKLGELKNFGFLDVREISKEQVVAAAQEQAEIGEKIGLDARYLDREDGLGVKQSDLGRQLKEEDVSLQGIPISMKLIGMIPVDAWVKRKEGDNAFFVRVKYQEAHEGIREIFFRGKERGRVLRLFKRPWHFLNVFVNPPESGFADITINVSHQGKGVLQKFMICKTSDNELEFSV